MRRRGDFSDIATQTAQPLMARKERPFAMPGKFLADLDAQTAAQVVAAAADIVLVLDREGVIRDLALASSDLLEWGCQHWMDKPWSETVTVESLPKVQTLLEGPASAEGVRWRQVNHPSPTGRDLPVSYTVMRMGRAGYSLALGRDLRPQIVLQQRLVAAQHSMERDYWRLRQAETRYRLLFQTAAEPLIIFKDSIDHIEEANPAAHRLFGDAAKRNTLSLAEHLEPASLSALRQMIDGLRTSGRGDAVTLRLTHGAQTFSASATPFRQDNTPCFLLRLSLLEGTAPAPSAIAAAKQLWPGVIDHSPDAWVVTDATGRVLSANQAFLDMAQLTNPEQVRGHSLERWLGRSEVDFRVLATNLRQHGSVRLFATQLQSEHGLQTEVEVSATACEVDGQPCFGFSIRDMERRLDVDGRGAKELPRSAGQMTELVGRMPLKDIVRETTDLIEQLCIEAALQLTGDNRASAAEMLGLSRQSLYIKLRRYGIGDLGGDSDAPEAEVP